MPRPVQIFEPIEPLSAVVFGSPHSGRLYPPDLLGASALDSTVLRSSEDAYVDLLLSEAPRLGAPLITTQVPRAYVDFNRADTEFDPALIDGAPRHVANPRIASGLGVIARVVAGGRPIYRGKIALTEAARRIDTYWRPYHEALDALLARQRARFGRAILVDVHSMPSTASQAGLLRNIRRPEVILGDRFGAACDPALTDEVEAIWRRAGFRVVRNAPFAGAYILQRHGQPRRGVHAIQIEIDRALYLDEARVTPGPGFEDFQSVMTGIIAQIAAIGGEAAGVGLAAE